MGRLLPVFAIFNAGYESTNRMMEASKKILPAVAAAIFNEKGEILLQKRMDTKQWCLISGHVEFGETVEDAILREIKEETDTNASIVRLIGVYSSPASQTYHYTNNTVQYITSYFEAKLAGDLRPEFTNEETVALQFFPASGLPADLALMNEHWLSDAMSISASTYIR